MTSRIRQFRSKQVGKLLSDTVKVHMGAMQWRRGWGVVRIPSGRAQGCILEEAPGCQARQKQIEQGVCTGTEAQDSPGGRELSSFLGSA